MRPSRTPARRRSTKRSCGTSSAASATPPSRSPLSASSSPRTRCSRCRRSSAAGAPSSTRCSRRLPSRPRDDRRSRRRPRSPRRPPRSRPPRAGLFVLCRSLEQANAALDAGADGVNLDFLELTGTGDALRALRARRVRPHVTLAPPRIRKPGEEKIDRYLASLAPDAILVRGLGALHEGRPPTASPRVGDFSLNVTNSITASEVLVARPRRRSRRRSTSTPGSSRRSSRRRSRRSPRWSCTTRCRSSTWSTA